MSAAEPGTGTTGTKQSANGRAAFRSDEEAGGLRAGAPASTAGPLITMRPAGQAAIPSPAALDAKPRGAGEARPTLKAMFKALEHRNFRLFWFGQMVSLIGTWMQMIARAWLVWDLTGSGAWLGITTAAASLPVLLLTLYAGVVVDRVSKHKIVVMTQIASMVLAFLLAAVTWLGVVDVWHVLAISVLLGAANAFDAPARQAFVVEMVGKDDLLNAVALNSTVFNLARVIGPAIAGALLALTGPAVCFFLNGLSFVAVIASLLMMRLPRHVPREQKGSSWANLLEGFSYIRRDDTVRSLLILVAVTSLFGMNYATLMPIMAEQVLGVGESGYGALMAAAGFGALIGALGLTVISGSGAAIRGKLIMGGAVGFAIFLALFALSPWYPLSLVLIAFAGWAVISQNATTNTVIQTTVPDHLRGRVMSVYALLFLGVAPAGGLVAGVLADLVNAPFSLVAGAAVCAATAILLWVRRPDLVRLP